MDLNTTYNFLAENITDWLRVTALTLARPISRFELVDAETDRASEIVCPAQFERQLLLHPKLLAFAVPQS